jgi:hypothetical protein
MSFSVESYDRVEGFTFIYALADPITLRVRYIGKSNNPRTRLLTHVSESLRGRSNEKKSQWIRGLLSKGLSPQLFILAQVPINLWEEHEREWIRRFQKGGADITNVMPGGGDHGIVDFTGERGRKRAAAMRGRKPSRKICSTEYVGIAKLKNGIFRAFATSEQGKRITLGNYPTIQEAIAARKRYDSEGHVPEKKTHRIKDTRNKSGVAGVCHCGRGKDPLWRAYYCIGGKQTKLGTFRDLGEAIKCRKNAENGIFDKAFLERDKRKIDIRNESGFSGVIREGNTWRANVQINGKQVRIGRFRTIESAAEAIETVKAGDHSIIGRSEKCLVQSNNTSGVRGVSYMPSRNRWQAYFRPPYGKTRSLGKFKTLEAAIAARKAAEQNNQ